MFQLHEVQSVSESVGIYYRVISPHWGNIKTCCLCYTYVCIQSRCSCWTLFVLKWKMLTERAIKEMNFYGVWAHVHLCVCCDILTHKHSFCMTGTIQNDVYIYTCQMSLLFLFFMNAYKHNFLHSAYIHVHNCTQGKNMTVSARTNWKLFIIIRNRMRPRLSM